jgi:hypothetical protein
LIASRVRLPLILISTGPYHGLSLIHEGRERQGHPSKVVLTFSRPSFDSHHCNWTAVLQDGRSWRISLRLAILWKTSNFAATLSGKKSFGNYDRAIRIPSLQVCIQVTSRRAADVDRRERFSIDETAGAAGVILR